MQVVVPVVVVAWKYKTGAIDQNVPLIEHLQKSLYSVPLQMAYNLLPSELLDKQTWSKEGRKQSMLKLIGWILLLLTGIGSAAFYTCKFYFSNFNYFYELVAAATVAVSLFAFVKGTEKMKAQSYMEEPLVEEGDNKEPLKQTQPLQGSQKPQTMVEKRRDYSLMFSTFLLTVPPMMAMFFGPIVAGIGLVTMIVGFMAAQFYYQDEDESEGNGEGKGEGETPQ